MQCANNLRQIALALHNYAEMHPAAPNSAAPVPLFPAGTVPHPGLQPEQRLSWYVEVLPFLEQDNLYRRIDRLAGWEAAGNIPAVQTPLKVLHCPDWGRESAPELAHFTPYLGMAGVGPNAADLPAGDRLVGIFGNDRRTALAAVTDGMSCTLLVLESAWENGPWAQGGPATVRGLDPREPPYLGAGRPFGGTHFAENTIFGRGPSTGCNAALADGSVRFLANSVTAHTLEALATGAGGEAIAGEW